MDIELQNLDLRRIYHCIRVTKDPIFLPNKNDSGGYCVEDIINLQIGRPSQIYRALCLDTLALYETQHEHLSIAS